MPSLVPSGTHGLEGPHYRRSARPGQRSGSCLWWRAGWRGGLRLSRRWLLNRAGGFRAAGPDRIRAAREPERQARRQAGPRRDRLMKRLRPASCLARAGQAWRLGSLNNGRRQFRGRKGQIVMRTRRLSGRWGQQWLLSGQLFRKGRQSGVGAGLRGRFRLVLESPWVCPQGSTLRPLRLGPGCGAAAGPPSWLLQNWRLKRRHLSDYYGQGHLPEQRSWMFWLRCAHLDAAVHFARFARQSVETCLQLMDALFISEMTVCSGAGASFDAAAASRSRPAKSIQRQDLQQDIFSWPSWHLLFTPFGKISFKVLAVITSFEAKKSCTAKRKLNYGYHACPGAEIRLFTAYPFPKTICDALCIIVPLSATPGICRPDFMSAVAKILAIARKTGQLSTNTRQLRPLCVVLGWILLVGSRVSAYLG